jgi:hypothetical protein
MNLKTQLLKVHNRQNCDLIVKWIGNDQSGFDQLLSVLLHGDFKTAQRASWPFYYSAMANPDFVGNHLKEILENLKRTDIHGGVRRNTLNIFLHLPIPEKHEGEIMELCFSFISDLQELPAIKSSSLGILEKLSKKYPEILPEIKIIIEDQLSYGSTSFKKKSAGILKRLSSDC